jgi:hypothetical protein
MEVKFQSLMHYEGQPTKKNYNLKKIVHRGKETKEKIFEKIKIKIIDGSLLLIRGNLLIIAHILFKS